MFLLSSEGKLAMCAANQAMSPCLPKFTATNSAHLNRNDLQDERGKHIWEGEGLDALELVEDHLDADNLLRTLF